MAGSPQGPAASGARKDVTGIPVSVLLSGVEALKARTGAPDRYPSWA